MVFVLVVSEFEEKDGGKIFIFKICEDVNWFNGDLVMVYDFEYVWKKVVDLKIVVVYGL